MKTLLPFLFFLIIPIAFSISTEYYSKSMNYFMVPCYAFKTQSECVAGGCYWCDGVCQESPCPPKPYRYFREVSIPGVEMPINVTLNVTIIPESIEIKMDPGRKVINLTIISRETDWIEFFVNISSIEEGMFYMFNLLNENKTLGL